MVNKRPTGKPEPVRGDFVRIEADHRSRQPYRITLAKHRCVYDVSLIDGSDPPALSGLRLVPIDAGVSVGRGDLVVASNVVNRLAAIAAQFAQSNALDRAAEDNLRGVFDRLTDERGAELAQAGIDFTHVRINSWSGPAPVSAPRPVKRGRGRPQKSVEFYRRVAEAAYAEAKEGKRASVAAGAAQRIAQWPDWTGDTPNVNTVNDWLKRARKLGFYQGPRARPTATTDTTDRHATTERNDQ